MINISIPLFNFYKNDEDMENYLLVVENKKILYSLLKDIGNNCIYEEYIQVYDENEKKLKVNEYIDFVPSILSIDINNKKNINSLYKLIKRICNDDIKQFMKDINEILKNSFNLIRLDIPLDIIENIDIDEDDYLKLINIKIVDNDESILERINSYIKTTYELRNIKIYVFYNLFSFLDEDEIKLLINNCQYYDIKIINIENNDLNFTNVFNKIILDKDICLLK